MSQEHRPSRRPTELEVLIATFNIKVKLGPAQICLCCKGLWFPKQINKLSRAYLEEHCEFREEIYQNARQLAFTGESFKFCVTCHSNIKACRKPKGAISNGLDFPEIPHCLRGLTPLEERLISPRLPFMKIKSIGHERQSAIKGAVVNVPIPVSNIVTSLPRAFKETEVIQLHLKRRMEYGHDFMAETIRPSKIADAIRYLVNTELYRKHNVSVNEQWISDFTSETVPFVASQADSISRGAISHPAGGCKFGGD